jgi:hypothetical protein
MPSFDRASRNDNDTYWSGMAGMLAIQLAVLFGLSVAAMVYLNWSSNAAVAEFMAAGKPSASSRLPQPSPPVQTVKNRTACAKRA